jgi:hypothetical protein
VSAPWWHPESNPLRDVQEVMREIERGTLDSFMRTGRLDLPPRDAGDLDAELRELGDG